MQLTLSALALALFPQAQVRTEEALDVTPASRAVDVPLSVVRRNGNLGFTVGASFLDYDADGWIDLFVNWTGELRRNTGEGMFELVADLDEFLPPPPASFIRYGSSCADFDEDGFPDIAGEPHSNFCFYLLKNLGGTGAFRNVATDAAVIPAPLPCAMAGETFCWGDVDDDGDLDLFAPAYPDEVAPGSGGNHFYENLGVPWPGGPVRFALATTESGLEIPPGVNRPEGAQFVDVDRDGDLDLYCNGTLYQNVSRDGGPRFRALGEAETGITFGALLDEGALFFDYDLDGDQDLLVLHAGDANRLYENRGDGTFVHDEAALESPTAGTSAGCSAVDWDLDGDLDLTTGSTFRRNLTIETGANRLRLATHSITGFPLGALLPAWGDWDRDGDLDCALAMFGFEGHLLRNTTYRSATPASARLALRVRPLEDSASVPAGLETEFGATVEVRPHGDASGRVRRNFTASSHGYLSQSEYALTFALPPGPDASAPVAGIVFDVSVDFPSREDAGLLRIDRGINPVLGGLRLAWLEEREIAVFRSGRVRIDGVVHEPRGPFSTRLSSSGRLASPNVGAPLPTPSPAPAASWSVGVVLDTYAARGPLRLEELVLDGELARVVGSPNVVLWDVTHGRRPRVVHAQRAATSPDNARSYLSLAVVLLPQREYRLVCDVLSLRASILADGLEGELANLGGLSFENERPDDPAAVLGASTEPGRGYVELRYRALAGGTRAPRGER